MPEGSKIPTFRTVEEAADFWDTHSPLDYLDELEPAEVAFAPDAFRKHRERSRELTVKLPESTIRTLRALARAQGTRPTTLIRRWIMERLNDVNEPSPTAPS
jgi:CopG antitoxin of type II toxin-antitoxin system